MITDDEVLAAFARAVLDGGEGERTKAPYQIAVTVCELCGRGWQDSGGRRFELSSADIDRACCDAERIGSLEASDPERATQDVTPAKRRLVRRRDKGRCRVPGCRSTRCLEIHHIVARSLGGSHELENTILICDSCHAALHRGLITISGTSMNLLITRRREVAFEVEPPTEEQPDENAHVGMSGADTASVSNHSADQLEETIDRHELGARVGTSAADTASVWHDSADQLEETIDRHELGAHARAGTSTDQIDEHERREPSAHVGTNLPQHSASRPSVHRSKFDRERVRADARSALVNLGYRPGEAGKAVDAAMRPDEVLLDEILREALRFLRPPLSR